MKKICFITRHAIVNYGSFLQTYATQKLFEDYGYNAEVLDYVREDEEYHNVTELLLKKSKKWNRNIFTRLIYRIVQWPDHYICGRAFEKERAKYLNLSERKTFSFNGWNKFLSDSIIFNFIVILCTTHVMTGSVVAGNLTSISCHSGA